MAVTLFGLWLAVLFAGLVPGWAAHFLLVAAAGLFPWRRAASA